jgi:3-oxoacyl-[acyl-carrier protein] reductase
MAESARRDRIVLITGASRGIGFVTAQVFLKDGTHLAIGARDPVRLAAAERALATNGPVWARAVDLRDPAQIRAFVDAALAHYGRIDVLVNNAGVAWVGEFARETPDSIDTIIDINVKGLMHVTRTTA